VQYHSTPLRPQSLQTHLRRPSTSSSTSSSPTRIDKECRTTRLASECQSLARSNVFDSSRFLGTRAVAVLNQWFQSNRDYPYPDDERTEQLADEAGKCNEPLTNLSNRSVVLPRHHSETGEEMVCEQTCA
jgi:hypothetical protein